MAQNQGIFTVGGKKLRFYLTGLNRVEYANYKKLIHVRGGIVTRRLERSLTWTFCKPEFYKNLPGEHIMYDIKFIDDCIKENTLKQNLLQYKLSKCKVQLGTSIVIIPISKSSSTPQSSATSLPSQSNCKVVNEKATNPEKSQDKDTIDKTTKSPSTDHCRVAPRIRSIVTSHINLSRENSHYLDSSIDRSIPKSPEESPTKKTRSTKKGSNKSPSKGLPLIPESDENLKKKRSRTLSENSSDPENNEYTKKPRLSQKRERNKKGDEQVEESLSEDMFSSEEENRINNVKEKQKTRNVRKSPRFKTKNTEKREDINAWARTVIDRHSKKNIKNSKKVNKVAKKADIPEIIILSDDSDGEPVRIGTLIEKERQQLEARRELEKSPLTSKKDSQVENVYPTNKSKLVPNPNVHLPKPIGFAKEVWKMVKKQKIVSEKSHSQENETQEQSKQRDRQPFVWNTELDMDSDTDFTLTFDVENVGEVDSELKNNTESKRDKAGNPTSSHTTTAREEAQFDEGNLGSSNVDTRTQKSADTSEIDTHFFDVENLESNSEDTQTVAHSQKTVDESHIDTHFFDVENLGSDLGDTQTVAHSQKTVDKSHIDTQFFDVENLESDSEDAQTVAPSQKTVDESHIDTQFFAVENLECTPSGTEADTNSKKTVDEPDLASQFFSGEDFTSSQTSAETVINQKESMFDSEIDTQFFSVEKIESSQESTTTVEKPGDTDDPENCMQFSAMENFSTRQEEGGNSLHQINENSVADAKGNSKSREHENLTQKLNELERSSLDLDGTLEQEIDRLDEDSPDSLEILTQKSNEYYSNFRNLNKRPKQKSNELQRQSLNLNEAREPNVSELNENSLNVNKTFIQKENELEISLPDLNTTATRKTEDVENSEKETTTRVTDDPEKCINSLETQKFNVGTRPTLTEDTPHSTSIDTGDENFVQSQEKSPILTKTRKLRKTCKDLNETRVEIVEEPSITIPIVENTGQENVVSSSSGTSTIDKHVEEPLEFIKDEFKNEIEKEASEMTLSHISLSNSTASVKILSPNKKDLNVDHDYYNHTFDEVNTKPEVSENGSVILEMDIKIEQANEELELTQVVTKLEEKDSFSSSVSVLESGTRTCSLIPTDTVSLRDSRDATWIDIIEKSENNDRSLISLDSMNELSSNNITEDDGGNRSAVSDRVLTLRPRRNGEQRSMSLQLPSRPRQASERKKESNRTSPIRKKTKVIQGLNVGPIEITRFKECAKRVYSRKVNSKEKSEEAKLSPPSSSSESSSNAEESRLDESKIPSYESSGLNSSIKRDASEAVEQNVNISTHMGTFLEKNNKKITVLKRNGNVAEYRLKPYSCRSTKSEFLSSSSESENVNSTGKVSAKKPKFVIIERLSAGTSKRDLSISESKESGSDSTNDRKSIVPGVGYKIRVCDTGKNQSEVQLENSKAQNTDNRVNRPTRKGHNSDKRRKTERVVRKNHPLRDSILNPKEITTNVADPSVEKMSFVVIESHQDGFTIPSAESPATDNILRSASKRQNSESADKFDRSKDGSEAQQSSDDMREVTFSEYVSDSESEEEQILIESKFPGLYQS